MCHILPTLENFIVVDPCVTNLPLEKVTARISKRVNENISVILDLDHQAFKHEMNQ
jgi:hypothetical protein